MPTHGQPVHRVRSAFLGFALSLFGCIELSEPQPKKTTQLVVVLDLSTAPQTTPGRRCEELIARVKRTLHTPGVRRLDLLVLGTGSEATSWEPIVLIPWRRWAPAGGLYEHPEQAEAEERRWVEAVGERCRGGASATKSSPIVFAISRAAESLKAHCDELAGRREQCGRRFLALHSDLLENVDSAVSDALRERARVVTRKRGDRPTKPVKQRPLPHIDMPEVELFVCGVAGVRVASRGRDGYAPDVTREIWSRVLGARTPEFNVSCPSEVPK